MTLVEELKESLSIPNNLYDIIRIVDPANKTVIFYEENKEQWKINKICYRFLEKNTFCSNCIAMRAYLENDTFVKTEYKNDEVFLVIACPVVLKGTTYIVEMLKDISRIKQTTPNYIKNSYYTHGLIDEMNDKIVRDELTNVYNRRYIDERLPVDINSSLTNKKTLSIIMADIDLFKKVNEKYGHAVGDKILLDFASFLKSSIKNNSDWIGRYDGEAFLIVLNNTSSDDAYKFAERIRKQLENIIFSCDDVNINITSSFGIYSLSNNKVDVETLISNANNNLYKAKSSGRNKTIVNN